MALVLARNIVRLFEVLPPKPSLFNTQGKLLHSSIPSSAGADWRKQRGMPANPNAYGPLTDLPDYTYLDGRRTPVGPGKLKRALEQEKWAEKIMTLSSEIDFAVDRRKELDIEEEQRKQSILDRKLKAKGESFRKNSTGRRSSSENDS